MVNAPDCGSGTRGFKSHYPPQYIGDYTSYKIHLARWSSGLRHRPFTAATRVRIPYGSPFHNEPLAQSVEHLTFNQGVPRSSRGWLTISVFAAEFRLILKTRRSTQVDEEDGLENR